MTPDGKRLSETVARVDALLSAGNFSELERLCSGVRIAAGDMRRAVEAYPEALAQRPNYEFREGEVVHVRESDPPAWSVYLHLWRKAGGQSDLTAELTLADTGADLYRVQIDGIHVL